MKSTIWISAASAWSPCQLATPRVERSSPAKAYAFSQSVLAAGASATIPALWRVAARPTASFMNQFYDSLGNRVSKAERLQSAKLRFLHSNSVLAEPRYWAAFVLNGDGWDPTPRVIPWS